MNKIFQWQTKNPKSLRIPTHTRPKPQKMNKKKTKIIIKFEPDSNFEREFVEFVEEVLACSKNNQKKIDKKAKNGLNKSSVNNPPL